MHTVVFDLLIFVFNNCNIVLKIIVHKNHKIYVIFNQELIIKLEFFFTDHRKL